MISPVSINRYSFISGGTTYYTMSSQHAVHGDDRDMIDNALCVQNVDRQDAINKTRVHAAKASGPVSYLQHCPDSI